MDGIELDGRLHEGADGRARRGVRSTGRAICGVALLLSSLVACGGAVASARPVDWGHLKYPVDCYGTPTAVLDAVQVEGTGKEPVTVVLLQCVWEDGTGWGTVLSYTTRTPKPEVLQAVMTEADGWSPVGVQGDHYLLLHKGGGGFSLRVAGARGNAARCCLDVFATLHWDWSGGRFQEVGHQPDHSSDA